MPTKSFTLGGAPLSAQDKTDLREELGFGTTPPSTAGLAMLTGADAAAQRTAIGATSFTAAQVTEGASAPVALTGIGRPIDAIGLTLPVPIVLASASRLGSIKGSGATETVLRKTVKGGLVRGGSLITFSAQMNKYAPHNASTTISVGFQQGANYVELSQTQLAGFVYSFGFDSEIRLSGNRRWAYIKGGGYPAIHQLNSISANANLSNNQFHNDYAGSSTQAHQHTVVGFATYSSSPVVENVLINFDADFDIVFRAQIANNDTFALDSFIARCEPADESVRYNLRSTLWAGDSYVAGAGATPGTTDPVSLFGLLRKGRPMLNFGLAGQNTEKIVDRVIAEGFVGRTWDMVLWAGANDATGSSTDWINAVNTQLTRLLAFRAAGSRLLILNQHPTEAWFTPGSVETARVAFNSWLAAHATYGPLSVDISTPLRVGGVNGRVAAAYMSADGGHLLGAGYQVVADAVHARATANGWAA